MNSYLPENFTKLLLALQYRKTYVRALYDAKFKYLIKNIDIEELNPLKVLESYQTVIKKFYLNRTQSPEGKWYQNEYKIYIWLLVGYLFLHKKTIQEMKQIDWSYFSDIFCYRMIITFQYHALSLIHTRKSQKWTKQESQLLQKIIQEEKLQNKWLSISKELYIKSDKKYYRSARQCREKWLNHLDPVKKKTCWTLEQDLIILTNTVKYGNKWSLIVKQLQNTRTQHMVKNRYKHLISKQIKKYPNTMSEKQICEKLINHMKQSQLNHQFSSQKNFIVDMNPSEQFSSFINQSQRVQQKQESHLIRQESNKYDIKLFEQNNNMEENEFRLVDNQADDFYFF